MSEKFSPEGLGGIRGIKNNLDRYMTIARVLGRVGTLRKHDGWTGDQLEDHQNLALAALRDHAYANSPFYQEFHRGLEDAPLQELPVLTKQTVMDNFDTFATDRGINLEDVRTHLAQGGEGRFMGVYEAIATSGSTGNPGIFLYDRDEWITLVASLGRTREWAGLKVNPLKRARMAMVASTNANNLSARVGNTADTPIIPTLRISAIEPIEEIVDELNEWQPESLVAYASMAYYLAQQQLDGALHIDPGYVFSTSEVLTPHMRQTIESVWDKVVFDSYAATETSAIASECSGHHGLHVFEDLLIVENVDEHNQPVPAGQFGEKLLVTTLFSRTQPLIRYEISDCVRFSDGQADCKLPYKVIDGIQGRVEDNITLHDNVTIHPNLFHDVMEITPNKGWQVVQEVGGVRVLVMGLETAQSAESIRQGLDSAFTKMGAPGVTIVIEQVDSIPKSSSGKTPLIKALK